MIYRLDAIEGNEYKDAVYLRLKLLPRVIDASCCSVRSVCNSLRSSQSAVRLGCRTRYVDLLFLNMIKRRCYKRCITCETAPRVKPPPVNRGRGSVRRNSDGGLQITQLVLCLVP